MTDLATAILSSACLCGLSLLIVKMCSKRQAEEKYILITQQQYEAMTSEKNYFVEQPLPDYSEVDRLIAQPVLQPAVLQPTRQPTLQPVLQPTRQSLPTAPPAALPL
jgi:hypothetical protein